jgi:YcaO-like protein with predicted kinase domain
LADWAPFSNDSLPAANLKYYRSGTHRVTSPCSTLAHIERLVGNLGITRVADLTGLDYLGIPVAASVRPGSQSLSVHQGKGLTITDAKVSAIMEAAEYHCAEQTRQRVIWEAAANLDRNDFVLPRRSARRPLPRDCVIPWIAGSDLMKKRSVLLPEELVALDFSRPRREGHGWFISTSNGLAAGNTMAEALLHAICEVIERDAFSLWLQGTSAFQTTRRIDPCSTGDPTVAFLLAAYSAASIEVSVWETTSDIAVPSFFCLIDDRHGKPPFLGRSAGSGCHPSAVIALCRALTEAAQSRLTLIAGARDDIDPENYSAIGWQFNLSSLIAAGGEAVDSPATDIRAESFDTPSIEEDLDAILARLRKSGIDTVGVVDLTDADLAIPCVRVVVPGLEGMCNKPGYKPGRRAKAALRA